MTRPEVTNHARRRTKERLKLPPRATARMAGKALAEGLDVDAPGIPPPIRGKMLRARANGERGGVYRLYRGALYVFSSELVLLTVLDGLDDPHQSAGLSHKDGKLWRGGERCIVKRGQRPPRDTDDDDLFSGKKPW